MTFAEKIEKKIGKNSLIEIGEVKTHQAYLYAKEYEIVLTALPHRKVLEMKIQQTNNRGTLLLNEIGTLSYLR